MFHPRARITIHVLTTVLRRMWHRALSMRLQEVEVLVEYTNNRSACLVMLRWPEFSVVVYGCEIGCEMEISTRNFCNNLGQADFQIKTRDTTLLSDHKTYVEFLSMSDECQRPNIIASMYSYYPNSSKMLPDACVQG